MGTWCPLPLRHLSNTASLTGHHRVHAVGGRGVVRSSASKADSSPSAKGLLDDLRKEVDARDTVPLQEVAGGVVCLGKFDALHLGHRALAERAATIGHMFMLSFSNMAAVLGWEPRLPLVASCHRPAVLRQWASVCGGIAPREVLLDFRSVRSLSPAAFVDLLADQLAVKGIVAGDNYRFGYKAAGDAAQLQSLGAARGLAVAIVGSVQDCGPACAPGGIPLADRKISSTRVREALQRGDLQCVEQLLGRRHQLAVGLPGSSVNIASYAHLKLPRLNFLNEPPCLGTYEALLSIIATGRPQQQISRRNENGLTQESDGLDGLELGLARVRIDVENLGIDFHDVGKVEQLEHRIRTSSAPQLLSLEFVSDQR
ncbi:hypothetical protein KFL_001760220 [Klebsormidium nitens]|uniref:FAD synthase n=1 Tax=Klebsormidium nitens TaxID=105231 RepID=A0A1Y1I0Y3_KLENI|nr:hypothetical protein KFL_001760220 [Klebsormidium nitens]|eukprot:GAQ84113.1 hypothetical protein KFL_001760220 [Klebsormidium nitens]